ncbi:MAG TPA: biotin carboxylase N-terminal domain-containing protein [Bacteroidales bacterium]|jgi:acetyl/propionyl-CoA carboxylase alpha subunit|nr:biotin carboxylase N-terminal domain-containing protein [Bacteroidales bacterium]
MPITIRNILIANRGEIALRIIRTIRESGLSAIGIYTEMDKQSPWIRQCNQSWSLGDGSLSDTYLNIERIISIAKQSGADAIHPGYGFLSENFRLAEACEKNNIIFIGPSSEVLKNSGNKQIANELAQSLGIPVTQKITGTIEELTGNMQIQYPVFAKAVAGGGGKGIRIARSQHELKEILKTVSAEALNYFGDNRIFLEKCIENGRHIEVQVLADSHGNIVHLFERECSVQRRHQKLIEESPANNLKDPVRQSIIDAALKLAARIGLVSAGTIEFMLDTNDRYYFLEINPRIQVEHGVTELVTGIDIIREQISIAQRNRLSFKQDEIARTGHAIEVRVYSEDPENNMIPSPGKIHFLSFPRESNMRIDTAAESGAEILPDFDPLIAKIMIHGNSREDVLKSMKEAISKSIITGVHHNLSLLELILSDNDFVHDIVSTKWLDNNYRKFADRLVQRRETDDPVLSAMAAALIVLNRNIVSDHPWNSGYWRNVRQIRFRIRNKITELEYEQRGNTLWFFNNDDNFLVSSVYMDDFRLEYLLNGTLNKWFIVPEREGIIRISDGLHEITIERYLPENKDYYIDDELNEFHDDTVFAPQPGTIIDIKVSEGQQVSRGDYLLTIESMKLENTIMAVSGGVIKKINIKAGDRVKKNEPLIHLQQLISN